MTNQGIAVSLMEGKHPYTRTALAGMPRRLTVADVGCQPDGIDGCDPSVEVTNNAY